MRVTEYITKQEVLDILRDEQGQALLNKKEDTVAVLTKAMKRVCRLYAVRPERTALWKVIGQNKEYIYCGGCGFKTLAYKRTKYCPNCGKSMMNGVANDA